MKKRRGHYAWLVCVGATALYLAIGGIGINLFSVFQPFIVEEFGISNTEIAFLSTLRHGAQFLGLLVTLAFYRRVTLKCGLLLALGCELAGYAFFFGAKGYPAFAAGMCFVGLGGSLGGMIPLSMLMNAWFRRESTLAVSICSAASGLSMLGLPSLMGRLAETRGLRTAFLTDLGLMTALGLLALILLKNSPEEKGLQPFGSETSAENPAGKTRPGAPQKKIHGGLKKGGLPWLLLLAILSGAVCGPGWNSVSLLAKSGGYSTAVMSLAVSCLGVSLMVGKLLFGALAERISLYRTSLLYCGMLIAGAVGLSLSGLSAVLLFAGAALFGASLALITIGLVTWEEDWYAESERNGMKQRLQSTYLLGNLGFSLLPGIMADKRENGYFLFYAILVLFSLLILLILWKTYSVGRWLVNSQSKSHSR